MDTLLGAISQHNVGALLMRAIKQLPVPHTHLGMSYRAVDALSNWRGCIPPEQSETPESTQAILRGSDYGAQAASPYQHQDRLVVALSGLLENQQQIIQKLPLQSSESANQSQEQTLVALIELHLQHQNDTFKATQAALKELRGYFIVAVYFAHDPSHLICASSGPALYIGRGSDSAFFSSAPQLLKERAALLTELHAGDIARLSATHIDIVDCDGAAVRRDPYPAHTADQLPHLMLKEIHTQARHSAEFINHANAKQLESWLKTPSLFTEVQSVLLLASGSSHHAAQCARFWIESLAGIPTQVELASEYRYQEQPSEALHRNTLVVAISQSGETADTLAALKHAQHLGHTLTLAITNRSSSSLMQQADLQMNLRAGDELSVTSTKTFTAQLLSLFLLAEHLALSRAKPMNTQLSVELKAELRQLPRAIAAVIALAPQLKEWAQYLSNKPHLFFTARHLYYPIAMEGALKIKEVAYLHAEAYPGGELKHGPLTLVDANLPVIACLPWDALAEKMLADLHEVRSKQGEIFALSDAALPPITGFNTIRMPPKSPHLNPILYSVALQLLAYYTAVFRGNDVDTPRNISKTIDKE